MSKELDKVTLKPESVTLHFLERDGWRIRRRWQITLRRRAFELALRQAEVTVPWNEVAR